MNVVWEIIKEDDGTYGIFRDGIALVSSISDRWLQEQLAKYGFCGQEYIDIRAKLDESGRARYEFAYPYHRQQSTWVRSTKADLAGSE